MYKKLLILFLFSTIVISTVFFLKNLRLEKVKDVTIDLNVISAKENVVTIKNEDISSGVIKKEDKLKLQNYLFGKINPSVDKNFVQIPSKYTNSTNKIYLRSIAYDAYLKMYNAAKLDNINLKIVSGFRSFDYQKNIWENKMNGITKVNGKNLKNTIPDLFTRAKKVLEYSSTPGISRHHFGTDIDINSVEPTYFNTTKGQNEYNWLTTHAKDFGFCQPYNIKNSENNRTGFSEEKWHWSYKPISKDLTKSYQTNITDSNIKGFVGDKNIKDLNLIKNYVLGVNTACLN